MQLILGRPGMWKLLDFTSKYLIAVHVQRYAVWEYHVAPGIFGNPQKAAFHEADVLSHVTKRTLDDEVHNGLLLIKTEAEE